MMYPKSMNFDKIPINNKQIYKIKMQEEKDEKSPSI